MAHSTRSRAMSVFRQGPKGQIFEPSDETFLRRHRVARIAVAKMDVGCEINLLHGFSVQDYSRPSSSLASSLIMSLFHSGSKTMLICAFRTPSIELTFYRTSSMIKSAAGQLGAVNVISISTFRPSSTSTFYINPRS